jgi:hypothetical protein
MNIRFFLKLFVYSVYISLIAFIFIELAGKWLR